MWKYIVRRILLIIPVLLGAIIVIFTINYFSTTDPAMIKLGLGATDEEALEEMRESMGLNRPYIVQLLDYIWGLCRGDFGDSYVYSKTVWELLSSRIPNTLKIGIGSMILSVLVGIPLGLVAALHQNSIGDYLATGFAVVMNAMPGFLVAVILMLVFGLYLGWFPTSGADSWQSFVLPIIAAGVGPICQDARMTRSSVLEVIRQDYVRTARAKGLPEKQVITKHILRNSLVPILTMVGSGLGTCLAGSILVEMIFNIPGMGMLINSSIMSKDFITVQGCVVVCALVVAIANLITDLAYAFVDPRIRAQYTGSDGKKKKKKKTVAAAEEG